MLQNKSFLLKVTVLGLGAFLGVAMLRGCLAMPKDDKKSPIITHIEWGKIKVLHNGKEYQYRDCKLWPKGSKEWDWRETGTHHVPGIQIADLQEFIDKVDVVILTRGMDLDLQVPQETIDYVKNRGKECHVGETKKMVELYNTLVKEGKKVGGLFHSTC